MTTQMKFDAHFGSSCPSQRSKEQLDTAAMPRAEQASLDRCGAARLAGAPIVDPPRAADARVLLREDMPFYIALGFLKIFQTGHGDYWAFQQQRRERGLPDVSYTHLTLPTTPYV